MNSGHTSDATTGKDRPLRCAVIGVGYLGKFHAEKYTRIDGCKLVAVVDINDKTASEIASKYHVAALSDYTELFGAVDAVSIATPTNEHFKMARDFIQNGAHVLLEKPVCATSQEADELAKAVQDTDLVLQVGHIERFNPAVKYMQEGLQGSSAQDLKFIKASRLQQQHPRNNDIPVVLDLMIHDIDIALSLVNSPVRDIHAAGSLVSSKSANIAHAYIEFENNCVADLTTTRVAERTVRTFDVLGVNATYSLDLTVPSYKHCYLSDGELKVDTKTFTAADNLLDEIKHFVKCIRQTSKPTNSPIASIHEGRDALALAERIMQMICPQ